MSDSIASRVFGKGIYDLQEGDLSLFFKTEQFESIILKFKSYKVHSNANANVDRTLFQIAESLCAFLNSDGGLVVWGAPEGQRIDGRKEKLFKGNLTRIDIILEKDTLIRKLSSIISPLPPEIKIKHIPISSEGVCIIFESPRSAFAPHQIGGKYFIRLDGSNIPAPQYYIEALFKRIAIPKLVGYISFGALIKAKSSILMPIILIM